jgi:hypothetical protein
MADFDLMKDFYAIHSLANQHPDVRGGISCFVGRGLAPVSLIAKGYDHLLVKCHNIVFLCVYFHPSLSAMQVTDRLIYMFDLIDNTYTICVLGDFNCRNDIDSDKGQSLLSTMTTLGLTLANNKLVKTFISGNASSTIDLLFYSSDFLKLQTCSFSLPFASLSMRKHLPGFFDFNYSTSCTANNLKFNSLEKLTGILKMNFLLKTLQDMPQVSRNLSAKRDLTMLTIS